MRISKPVACFGLNTPKLVVAGLTAILLSGCSDSIERFSANYNNPSDNDPVYTASVPKVKRITKQSYKQPKAIAYADETIVQSPIARAPLRTAKAPAYDYVQSYKKPYKQKLIVQPEVQPEIAYDEQPVAPVYTKPRVKAPVYQEEVAVAPVYKTPTLKAPKYKAPSYSTEDVVADAPTEQVVTPTPTFKYKKKGIAAQQAMVEQPAAITPKRKVISLAEEEQTADASLVQRKAGGTYSVQSGDTLYSLGRKFNVSPFTIASLNGLSKDKTLSLGQTIKIPGGAKLAAAATQAKIKQPAAGEETIDDSADQAVADVPLAKKPGALTLPKPQAEVADVPAIPTDAGPALAMRWPVRGKVISDFGKKPSGLKNEGINISVPEGTSIRAAESGVVAYAGNELKGYGNLILIRHAGGYVTAYAHAKSLNVKRGDTVKRGDVIAIAGQTGAVQSPQLHFEVRKGATALDPKKYLSSSTAMN